MERRWRRAELAKERIAGLYRKYEECRDKRMRKRPVYHGRAVLPQGSEGACKTENNPDFCSFISSEILVLKFSAMIQGEVFSLLEDPKSQGQLYA